jgi:hypothetical protein
MVAAWSLDSAPCTIGSSGQYRPIPLGRSHRPTTATSVGQAAAAAALTHPGTGRPLQHGPASANRDRDAVRRDDDGAGLTTAEAREWRERAAQQHTAPPLQFSSVEGSAQFSGREPRRHASRQQAGAAVCPRARTRGLKKANSYWAQRWLGRSGCSGWRRLRPTRGGRVQRGRRRRHGGSPRSSRRLWYSA